MWQTIKALLLKFIGGLFMEQKEGHWIVSKGSVAFWILLGHCLFSWQRAIEVSDGELYTLWALLGYSGVKVGADAVKGFKKSSNGGATNVEEGNQA